MEKKTIFISHFVYLLLFFLLLLFSLSFVIQDPPPSQPAGSNATTANSSAKLGTFRRMLNAIRYCFTKRSRSKKPDWLLDKQPHHHRSRSKSIPSEDVPPDASTANILCSHLSVDPSLPSHYRVRIRILLYVLNLMCITGVQENWKKKTWLVLRTALLSSEFSKIHYNFWSELPLRSQCKRCFFPFRTD